MRFVVVLNSAIAASDSEKAKEHGIAPTVAVKASEVLQTLLSSFILFDETLSFRGFLLLFPLLQVLQTILLLLTC
jgi:hypothetical protein